MLGTKRLFSQTYALFDLRAYNPHLSTLYVYCGQTAFRNLTTYQSTTNPVWI